MDKETRGLLIGMILGDGCIRLRDRLKNGKYKYESIEFRVKHSINQLDYCTHKANTIKGLFGRLCNVNFTETNIGPKWYKQCYFTCCHPYFKILYNYCYPNKKKTYSSKVLEMLTPLGIAYWYMDDGSARVNVNKQGIVSSVCTDIATMCTETQVDIIIEYFREVWDITFKKRSMKNRPENTKWYIQACTADSVKFVNLIKPHVIPSMQYKIDHVRKFISHECHTPKGDDIV